MSRIVNFFARIFRGEDIILVPQKKEQWEQQFIEGTWDYLLSGKPNTKMIAEYIRTLARQNQKRLRILDVGCGNGALAVLIIPFVEYHGFDISNTAIEQARINVPEGTFYVSDAISPPDGLGKFDIIVFNEMLYYVDSDEVLPKYERYANPDTIVCISVVRSWRSFFIWSRIQRFVRFTKRENISLRSQHKSAWDVSFGTFKGGTR